MVAIHSRVLGPAVGGCRMQAYPSLDAAVEDVLRLSGAMTLKCAAAGVPFGGAKSVIAVLDGAVPVGAARRDVLLDHADLINAFDGSYWSGPDIGTGPQDMLVMREVTPYSFCLPEANGGSGSSGGPTAVGVLAAVRAGARHVFGDAGVAGRRVVVAGYGSVGTHLATALAAAGADVIVSDVDESRKAAAQEAGLGWADPDKALTVTADVVMPSAVGGVLNPETVLLLDTALVVGPANNQLSDDAVAEQLAARGITWVPDFVASAGGIIFTLGREVERLGADAALEKVRAIEQTVSEVLAAATANGTTPLHEATALAQRRLAA